MVRGSGNVFRDLGFREPEARNLALRSEIMIKIEEFVERSGMTQARAAAHLGLTSSATPPSTCGTPNPNAYRPSLG